MERTHIHMAEEKSMTRPTPLIFIFFSIKTLTDLGATVHRAANGCLLTKGLSGVLCPCSFDRVEDKGGFLQTFSCRIHKCDDRIAFIGDSFIRRLRDSKLHLDFENGIVKFFAAGGLTVTKLLDSNIMEKILAYKPTYAFVHIGGNDLGSCNPFDVISNLRRLIGMLHVECETKLVIVGEIVYRNNVVRSGLSLDVYEQQRRQLNRHLEKSLKSHRRVKTVHFDKIFRFPLGYTGDGVHLNDDGMMAYRNKIFKVIKKLTS